MNDALRENIGRTADYIVNERESAILHTVVSDTLEAFAAEVNRDAAQLVKDMLEKPEWSSQPWAKMALTIAARAIERGRHWTPSERLDNLMDALTEDALEEMEDEDD